MKRKIEKLLMLICVMTFAMFIMAGEAKAEATSYGVYILGEEVTSDNMSGDGWRFEPAAEGGDEYDKLYLTNANLNLDESCMDSSGGIIAIMSGVDLEIVLTGDNTINMNVEKFEGAMYSAIYTRRDIRITGDGSLSIKAKDCQTGSMQLPIICVESLLEITEGIKLNIEGMNITKLDEESTVSCTLESIYAGNMNVHDNVEINISGFGIDLSSETDRGNVVGVVPGYDFNIGNNVKINIAFNDIVAMKGKYTGIGGMNIVVGNNSDISVELGNMTGKGNIEGLVAQKTLQVGNDSKVKIVGKDMVNEEALSSTYIGVVAEQIILAEGCFLESYNGKNSLFGYYINTIEMGKDSIIKGNGDLAGLVIRSDADIQYPIFGGEKYSDINELAMGEVELLGDTIISALNGETPAKYVEIGPLLTINLQCDNGTVDTKSFTMHNGHKVGTLPTPTRANYTFTGWYTAKTGGEKVTSDTVLTKSMTLYDRWEVTKPSAMSGFVCSDRTATNITLKWNKNASADGYVIEQYKDGKWVAIKTITKNATVSHKVTGLKATTAYKFRILPYKTVDGVKVYGGEATASVKTVPTAVKNFAFKTRTAISVTLKWTKNASANGYVIEQYKGGKWVAIKTITKNATVSYKVTGLKTATTYKFRIKAYAKDGSNKLYSASYATKSVKTLPSAVKKFTYKNRTKNAITLKWAKNTSADGYVIEQYKGKKWVVIKTVTKKATVNYKVTGLKKGTTYKFRIKAYAKDGSKKIYSEKYTTKSIKTL